MLLGLALSDLTHAVIRLLRDVDHTTAFWEDEPGQYRWVFDRDGERVRVRILYFDRAFTRVDDEREAPWCSIRSAVSRYWLASSSVNWSATR